MLDIEGSPDIDAGPDQLGNILVALGVARTRRIGVRQFIDDQQRRPAHQRRIEVEFAIGPAIVLPRQHFDALGKPGRVAAAVGFDEADNHVDPLRHEAPRPASARPMPCWSGRRAQEDGELAAAFAGGKLQQGLWVGPLFFGQAGHISSREGRPRPAQG